MHYPDLGTETPIASGPQVRAVGWLGAPPDDYPRGAVAPDRLDRILAFARKWGESTVELRWPVAPAPRTCALCGKAAARGNFAVPGGDVLYVCPELVAHYVRDHAYAPPAEFLAALMAAPLPGTVEYERAVEAYRAPCRDPWA